MIIFISACSSMDESNAIAFIRAERGGSPIKRRAILTPLSKFWACSSMVERYPDKIEVGGSIPPMPTNRISIIPKTRHYAIRKGGFLRVIRQRWINSFNHFAYSRNGNSLNILSFVPPCPPQFLQSKIWAGQWS